ncbi:MAG: sigma-70 family RNA polymerase sigma factor [Acidobacteriota bacterium]
MTTELQAAAPHPDLDPIGPRPDADLAERHRLGDPQAFDELYASHAAMVYNLAFRLSGRHEQAEDLSQEVFLRIHRHLHRFDGRSSLKTWIYRVTLNHCRSKLGRKRWPTRPLREESEDGVELIERRRGPEERALAEDAARRVQRALDEVPPVFREAVVLRDLEGLTYEEIAEILQIRLGTVRSRIARGRERLRQRLERADAAQGGTTR